MNDQAMASRTKAAWTIGVIVIAALVIVAAALFLK